MFWVVFLVIGLILGHMGPIGTIGHIGPWAIGHIGPWAIGSGPRARKMDGFGENQKEPRRNSVPNRGGTKF